MANPKNFPPPPPVPLKDIRKSVNELHELDLCYISTHGQLGDIMTKSLPPKQHWNLSKILMNIPNCDLLASLQFKGG